MKLFNLTNVRLVIMLAVVAFLFSFTSKRNSARKLAKSEVIFVGDNAPFVKQETVNKLLIENKKDASGIEKDKLDLNKLEKAVNAHQIGRAHV